MISTQPGERQHRHTDVTNPAIPAQVSVGRENIEKCYDFAFLGNCIASSCYLYERGKPTSKPTTERTFLSVTMNLSLLRDKKRLNGIYKMFKHF